MKSSGVEILRRIFGVANLEWSDWMSQTVSSGIISSWEMDEICLTEDEGGELFIFSKGFSPRMREKQAGRV